MATMHPVDIENYNYTATEKELYIALNEQLPEKYHVFYSIRWFETTEDNRRVDSESDFLIFDPSFGFLTIEVKGGTGIRIEDGRWFLNEYDEHGQMSIRELKCSPYEQAEKSMRHFYNYFTEEYNQNFNGVYGCAAAFPRYAVNSLLAPKELTIDAGDMNNLRNRINEIFHYWRNRRNIVIPFSAEQRSRFINVVNKRISLAAAAGALIPVKEQEFAKINFVQDSVLDFLYNYKQARIVGGAGTGKTFVGMKKAIRDALDGKKVLFLCCSEELIQYVKDKIGGKGHIRCCTYHQIMLELLGKKYTQLPENENGNRCCYELVQELPLQFKYDSIIVDEAQDFDVDMGLAVRALLKNEAKSSLYIFYDENQNVFSVNADDAFGISAPPYVLRYNIRNTGSIYQYAVDHTHLGTDTIANNIIGVPPEVHNYNKPTQALKALTNIVNHLVQKEYVDTKSIVIVSDVSYESSILSNEKKIGAYKIYFGPFHSTADDEICFKTAAEFKGLEGNVVIYLTHSFSNLPASDNCSQKDYVAFTRARYYLYVLNTKCKVNVGE